MTLRLTPETESRILAEAARRNQPPEAVIDAALEALLREDPSQNGLREAVGETEEDRQKRLHALMEELLLNAQEIVPEPEDSPTRLYYRDHPFAQGVAEKLRKQGFNV